MTVVPIHRALVALVLGAVLGGALLFRAQTGVSTASLLVRALLGLAILAASVVHPALAVVLALLVVVGTWRGASTPEATPPAPLSPVAIGALLVGLALVTLRPPVPLFWDEAVWLAKARVACDGGAALMARVLDPQSELVPRGYPIVAAVIEAAFAMGDPSLASLVGGGAALVLASFALYVVLLARAGTRFEQGATLFVLAATPLAWAHLRSVQLDLPTGLALGALLLSIELAGRGDRLGTPAALASALLLGIKDEGAVLALAAAVGASLPGAHPAARRTAWLGAISLGLVVGVFRVRLAMAGSANDDHSLGTPTLDAALPVLREGLREAIDVRTWGLVPPVAAAAVAIAALGRGASPLRTRPLAVALALAVLFLLVAILVGPQQVRDFALEGTLLNRLGIELLPVAALLIPRLLVPAAQAPRTPSTDPLPGSGTAT